MLSRSRAAQCERGGGDSNFHPQRMDEMIFTTNPFAALSASISPTVMQTFVIVMIAFVVVGTLFDIVHKGSARFFFEKMRKAQHAASKPVSGGDKIGIAVQTGMVDVLTSAEFCNPRRRIAHLLGMYGFVAYALATFMMVFFYPSSDAAGFWAPLWWIGALAVCVGGYWFWFFIRADVSAEGQSPFRLMRADLFILSLLASCTAGLIWAYLQAHGSDWSTLFLGIYLIATVVLFGGVPWSKFSHMFFKPAAAFQKRIAKANGSRNNLPEPADRTNPADRDRHSMELLQDAPLNMGLGIKREAPRHY